MPSWIVPILTTALVGLQLWLIKWTASKFDNRLNAVENAVVKLELVIDRGVRHEAAISRLQEQFGDLAIEIARLKAH